jgi:hypothetical protein
MKQLADYHCGDIVRICEYDDLEELLSCYATEDDDPVRLLSHSGETVKLCWVPDAKDLEHWDGMVAVCTLTSEPETLLVPIAILIDVVDEMNSLQIDEIVEESSPKSPIIVRDVLSEKNMIEQLAAESIQHAYRYFNTLDIRCIFD